MRYVQLHSFYDRYLADFYAARPNLRMQPFQHQLRAILDDGFTAMHLWGEHLEKLGFDCHLLISNCPELQSTWALENGITHLETQDWKKEIVKKQIELLRPDILYIGNPIDFDSTFLRTVSFRPPVIAGWRAQTIFDYNDFTEFDAILSSDPYSRAGALKVGAKRTYHFLPGFPEWIADKVRTEPKLYDVGFCGQITRDHARRSQVVDAVSEYALKTKTFTPTFFVHQANPYPFQFATQFLRPARWGIEMHQAIKQTKVGLNVVIDFASGEAGNMRQFEITGTGSFLLTEYHPNLSTHFAIGTEVETYNSMEEMYEKIEYFSTHDAEREAIAARGQARCLKDHGMIPRTIEFAQILKDLLTRNGKSTGQFSTTQQSAAVTLPTTPGFGVSVERAKYFLSLGLSHEAAFILKELLANEPQHAAAKELYATISKQSTQNASLTVTGKHPLLFAVHDMEVVDALLDALVTTSAAPKKLTIVIDACAIDGKPLGAFEAQCNEAITKHSLWSSVTMLRGDPAKVGQTYPDQLALSDEVFFKAGTILPIELPRQCKQRPL